METLPDRKIDRAFVAKGGVSSWSTIAKGQVALRPDGSIRSTTPIPIPLYYSSALFENLDLVGVGLPFGVRYQLQSDNEGYWGLTFGSGFGTSEVYGGYFQPAVGLVKKTVMSPDTATQVSLVGRNTFFPDGGPSVWELDLSVGQEFQLGPYVWVQPGVTAAVGYTTAYSTTSGTKRYFTNEGFFAEYPLTVQLSFLPVKNWEITADYQFHFLGRLNETWEHRYSAGVTLYY